MAVSLPSRSSGIRRTLLVSFVCSMGTLLWADVTVTAEAVRPVISSGRMTPLKVAVTGTEDTRVTFHVQEKEAGGSVDMAGMYRAPVVNATTTYHVEVRSQADPSAAPAVVAIRVEASAPHRAEEEHKAAPGYRTKILDPGGKPVAPEELVVKTGDEYIGLNLKEKGMEKPLGIFAFRGDTVSYLKNYTADSGGETIKGKTYRHVGTLLWELYLRHHRPRDIEPVLANGPSSGAFHFSIGLRYIEKAGSGTGAFLVERLTPLDDDQILAKLFVAYRNLPSEKLENEIIIHEDFDKINRYMGKLTNGYWLKLNQHEQIQKMCEIMGSPNRIDEFILEHKGQLISFDGSMIFVPQTAATVREKFGVDY